MPNQIAKSETGGFKSLMAAQKDYITSIGVGLKDIIGKMSNYQAVCGYNILAQINVALAKEGLNFRSPKVDSESINNAIKYAIIYQLNSDNREVFVIVRNENRGTKDNPNWVKVIEVKPQYKGVLKIISTFGRDIKKVHQEWVVYEGDDFKYPTFKGLEKIPPEWTPKGQGGKIVRVVVPIEYKDGTVEFRIAERESVATNIKAQIKQSLMGKPNREVILAKISDMTLDDLLADKTLAPYVNETYTGLSRDEMLITKLVLNAVKRVAIDYSSALARELNEKTFDNADVYKPRHNADELLAQADAPMIEEKEIELDDEPKTPEYEQAKADAESNPEGSADDDFYSIFEDED